MGPFSKNIISSGRIGSIRAVAPPKSAENKSYAPPNRSNTGWIRPGRVKSGLDPSWVGPVFKKHSKTKRMFDNCIGSDRPNTGRMHPQIDRKRVGCTPKSAQHGSFAPASRPRHGRIRPSRPEFGSDPALDGSIFKLHCKTRVILHCTCAWESSQPSAPQGRTDPNVTNLRIHCISSSLSIY